MENTISESKTEEFFPQPDWFLQRRTMYYRDGIIFK